MSKSNETKYSLGITPTNIQERCRRVSKTLQERADWEGLRKQLKETGIRNSTLMALMPAETSAQISNSTNGIELQKLWQSSKVNMAY